MIRLRSERRSCLPRTAHVALPRLRWLVLRRTFLSRSAAATQAVFEPACADGEGRLDGLILFFRVALPALDLLVDLVVEQPGVGVTHEELLHVRGELA